MHASPPSLRRSLHDLRNVLNAVQVNAFAARQLVDDVPRTLACLERIEDACRRGSGVLQDLPAEETLATACALLEERLREAGGDAHVEARPSPPGVVVPFLLQQTLCVVGVECQNLGAHAFRLELIDTGRWTLRCHAAGLDEPGPLARAIADCGLADIVLDMAPAADGWDLFWALRPAV